MNCMDCMRILPGYLTQRHSKRSASVICPMPRFVVNTVRVVARVREREAVSAGVPAKPGIGRRGLEGQFQRLGVGRGDVDGAAGMVLAVARRGVDPEDVGDLEAPVQL